MIMSSREVVSYPGVNTANMIEDFRKGQLGNGNAMLFFRIEMLYFKWMFCNSKMQCFLLGTLETFL